MEEEDWESMIWLLVQGLRLVGVLCAFVYLSLWLWRRIISFALLPAQVVHSLTHSRLEENIKAQFQKHPGEFQKVTIEGSNEKLKLDAVEIVGQGREHKYLLYMNANGVCYEDILDEVYEYSRLLNCKAIVFNYRGVGASTLWPTCSDDIVSDGVCCIEWLKKERQLSDKDILVHGHSIGAAVGILALQRNNYQCSLVADRAFDDLIDLVCLICSASGKLDTSIVASFVFAYLAFTYSIIYQFGFTDTCLSTPNEVFSPLTVAVNTFVSLIFLYQFVNHPTFPIKAPPAGWSEARVKYTTFLVRIALCCGVAALPGCIGMVFNQLSLTCISGIIEVTSLGMSLGFLAGYKGWLVLIARPFVKVLGWNMDCGAAWKLLQTQNKMMLFHANDVMIPVHLNLLRSHNTIATSSDENAPNNTPESSNNMCLSVENPAPTSYNSTPENPTPASLVVELKANFEPAHMYPLMLMQERYQVIDFGKQSLAIL